MTEALCQGGGERFQIFKLGYRFHGVSCRVFDLTSKQRTKRNPVHPVDNDGGGGVDPPSEIHKRSFGQTLGYGPARCQHQGRERHHKKTATSF